MKKSNTTRRGFTIVELLITIVIVAILASLSVSAYSGMQQRTRDSRRVSDMNAIVKALEMYKIQTGSYPATNSANSLGGWEVSSINPSQFISVLKTGGVISTVPVDPLNSATVDQYGLLYKYYRYNAGDNGCDVARGAYYVLAIGEAESTSGQLSSSPGFQCPGRNWATNHGWVTGAYTK